MAFTAADVKKLREMTNVGMMDCKKALAENDGDMELVDGVRIKNDTGWVIVKPNEEFAACRVICGSYNQEYADELCDIYSNRLKRIIKKEEKKR